MRWMHVYPPCHFLHLFSLFLSVPPHQCFGGGRTAETVELRRRFLNIAKSKVRFLDGAKLLDCQAVVAPTTEIYRGRCPVQILPALIPHRKLASRLAKPSAKNRWFLAVLAFPRNLEFRSNPLSLCFRIPLQPCALHNIRQGLPADPRRSQRPVFPGGSLWQRCRSQKVHLCWTARSHSAAGVQCWAPKFQYRDLPISQMPAVFCPIG
ncbi:hypothetical protein F5884DRAFT_160947 [Xylogone sp. PMI_703]|nr:hypothetical protein F5884DRAFT_160947 [Xylogone sp. PMI_703]